MRGEPGSKVLLTIRRDGVDDYLYFTLTRQVINVASVASKMLAGDVAYLRIKMFQHGTHTEILDQVASSASKRTARPRRRARPPQQPWRGLVDEATAIADEFLEQGAIFTTQAARKGGGRGARPPAARSAACRPRYS